MRPAELPISLNGVTDLPPGKIANVVTFMERSGPPPARSSLPADLSLDTPPSPDVAAYRAIYRRVGENLLWTSRALMSDAVLSEWLNRPTTRVQLLRRGGEAVGLVELDLSEPETAEIVSFGVIPEEVGTGTAHLLMNAVIADLVAGGATRIWLHTCTFDHPAAVPFYMRHGFAAYKFAVEVFDDPRLTGHLPRSAAPQVPLLDRQP
jgi:GNAT superfamily N-acetyltransferase